MVNYLIISDQSHTYLSYQQFIKSISTNNYENITECLFKYHKKHTIISCGL